MVDARNNVAVKEAACMALWNVAVTRATTESVLIDPEEEGRCRMHAGLSVLAAPLNRAP